MIFSKRLVCAILAVCLPLCATAGDLPRGFTLGRFMPKDVWLYIHHTQNPERDFITSHWKRVAKAFIAAEYLNLSAVPAARFKMPQSGGPTLFLPPSSKE